MYSGNDSGAVHYFLMKQRAPADEHFMLNLLLALALLCSETFMETVCVSRGCALYAMYEQRFAWQGG